MKAPSIEEIAELARIEKERRAALTDESRAAEDDARAAQVELYQRRPKFVARPLRALQYVRDANEPERRTARIDPRVAGAFEQQEQLAWCSPCHVENAEHTAAKLRQQDLSYLDLSFRDLERIDLGGCDLRHANLSHSNLWMANLNGCDLRHAKFDFANLVGASLLGVRLNWRDPTLIGSLVANAAESVFLTDSGTYGSRMLTAGRCLVAESPWNDDWWGMLRSLEENLHGMDGVRRLAAEVLLPYVRDDDEDVPKPILKARAEIANGVSIKEALVEERGRVFIPNRRKW